MTNFSEASLPLPKSDIAPNAALAESARPWLLGVRNILMATTAALAVSGCTEEASFVTPPHVSPVAPAIADGITSEAFANTLLATQSDTDKARQMIPGVASGSQQIAEVMNRAVDAKVSDILFIDQRAEKSKLKPDAILPSITDPAIRQETANAIYVIQAGKVVRQTSGYGKDIPVAEAHAALQAIPSSQEDLRNNARQALDAAYAEKVARNYDVSSDKETEARKALDDIKDPAIQAQATKVIDAIDGEKLLTDLWISGKTETEAREDAANITDPTIKQMVLAGIQAAKRDSYAAAEAKYDVAKVGDKYKQELQNFGGAFEKDEIAGSNFNNQMISAQLDALEATEAAVGQRIATAHNLKPQEVESLPSLSNPSEVIDLSNLQGLQKIENNCLKVARKDDDSCSKQPTFDQFGEMVVKDGVLTVAFQHGGGLTDKIRSQIQTAINVNRPFLEAAFASGQLVSVHFIVDEVSDPFYLGGAREMYLSMPHDKTMSVDELTSAMAHETFHALTRNFFAGINVSDAQKQKLNAACNALVMTAYDDFEVKLRTSPGLLTDLRAAAKLEHEPIIDTLVKSVEQFNLEQVVGLNQQELQAVYAGTEYNECQHVPAASIRIIENAVAESGVKATNKDLKYLFETQAFKVFSAEWARLIEYTSIYENIINESSYVDTKSPDKRRFGHSEDKAAEVYASLPHAALRYPAKFTSGLRGLYKADRTGVLDFLGLTFDELEQYPSLKEYIQNTRAQYEAMR